MPLVFGNPWGLLALLAIPIIIALHFLQQETRRTPVTTLFLLEKLAPASTGGRRWEQLRNSLPLWLQILAALIIAWLLADPRWIRADSIQRVVVVADSSASMSAFQDKLVEQTRPRLEALASSAAQHEWVLLETREGGNTLYSGPELNDLLATLESWAPRSGQHDFAPAWRLAQSLAGGHGTVLFLSDRQPENRPGGVELLAVGKPTDNVGLTGFRVLEGAGGPSWEALVKNYSAQPATRSFKLLVEGQAVRQETLQLPPGESKVVKGEFPDQAERLEIVLDGDAFPLDDRLPIVRPKPKKITASLNTSTANSRVYKMLERLAQSLPGVVTVAGGMVPADVSFASFDPLKGAAPESPGLLMLEDTTEPGGYLDGLLVAEENPLNEGLNWQSLIVQESLKITQKENDDVLLWQGERPLIFLRRVPGGRQMVINFDPMMSNLAKLPAFVVLVNRFLEEERARKIAPEQLNVDTLQPVRLTAKPGEKLELIASLDEEATGETIRPDFSAPSNPGFFQVRQKDGSLLTAAAQFNDGREADLSAAASADTIADGTRQLALRNSENDPFRHLWIAGVLGLVLWNWAHQGRRRT